MRNCLEILGFFGILGGIFGIFLKEIFWKDLLGGFFGEDFFGRIFWRIIFEGIDLFVKILVFV